MIATEYRTAIAELVTDWQFWRIVRDLDHNSLAVAVSSSPNLHTVRATDGEETGAARPLAEHTGRAHLLGAAGSMSPSDDLTSAAPQRGLGEDGDVLDPSRGMAPGCNPEPADNCAP